MVLTTPVAFTLQMPGFAEVEAFVETIHTENLILNICPLEGLILLKLFSYSDNPERTKDLIDIEHIIHAYFDWFADEIYESDILEKYNDKQTGVALWQPTIAAHLTGRKMKKIVANSPNLRNLITNILTKSTNPLWQAINNGFTEN